MNEQNQANIFRQLDMLVARNSDLEGKLLDAQNEIRGHRKELDAARHQVTLANARAKRCESLLAILAAEHPTHIDEHTVLPSDNTALALLRAKSNAAQMRWLCGEDAVGDGIVPFGHFPIIRADLIRTEYPGQTFVLHHADRNNSANVCRWYISDSVSADYAGCISPSPFDAIAVWNHHNDNLLRAEVTK